MRNRRKPARLSFWRPEKNKSETIMRNEGQKGEDGSTEQAKRGEGGREEEDLGKSPPILR